MDGDLKDLLERLRDVDPAQIDEEIGELQDQIDQLRLVRAWLTGEKPPKLGKRGPRQPRVPRKPREQSATAERPPIDRSVDPKKRVIAYLTAAGPTNWTKLIGGTGLSPQQLSDVLKGDERTFRKREDNLWEVRRP
jgi:hypothetical protein